MPSPQIRRLTEIHQFPVVNLDNHDAFVSGPDHLVLFFSENPAKYPEANDVAMILPELVKAFGGELDAALIDASAAQELAARYGFTRWPALVFLRRGQYLGVISQMHNWEDYLRDIRGFLRAEPVAPPVSELPVIG